MVHSSVRRRVFRSKRDCRLPVSNRFALDQAVSLTSKDAPDAAGAEMPPPDNLRGARLTLGTAFDRSQHELVVNHCRTGDCSDFRLIIGGCHLDDIHADNI